MRKLTLGAVAALLLGVAGCGDDATQPAATQPVGTEVAGTAPATTPQAAAATAPAGPVPSKIVSLSPTATEMLFAIGAGNQVLAVDDQSNYPPEALQKPHDLSGFQPNVEAIAALAPDLVVIADDFNGLTPQLEQLGLTVWSGPAATSLDDVYTQIEQLGAITGHVGDAAELVSRMQTEIGAAVAAAPKATSGATYYHELSADFYSANSNTFIGQVYSLFGLKNIADTSEGDSDYPQLSAEFIISQSPDLVFLADTKCCGETPDTVAARPGWNTIAAVVNGNVVPMDDDLASRWGPRVVDYVKAVSAALAKVPVGG